MNKLALTPAFLIAAMITAMITMAVGFGPAAAQTVDGEGTGNPTPDLPIEREANKANPPKPKKPPFELAGDIDGLFVQLKRARDQRRAERISRKIWEKWHESDSKTVDLLTTWARDATSRKSYGAAMDLLDQVITLRPQYAEGFNQRATLHFIMKNYAKSIADIERTLALEPRHFGALAGLANILEQLGEKRRAMDTWYRALAVYPAMRSAQAAVLRLEEELAGSGI